MCWNPLDLANTNIYEFNHYTHNNYAKRHLFCWFGVCLTIPLLWYSCRCPWAPVGHAIAPSAGARKECWAQQGFRNLHNRVCKREGSTAQPRCCSGLLPCEQKGRVLRGTHQAMPMISPLRKHCLLLTALACIKIHSAIITYIICDEDWN